MVMMMGMKQQIGHLFFLPSPIFSSALTSPSSLSPSYDKLVNWITFLIKTTKARNEEKTFSIWWQFKRKNKRILRIFLSLIRWWWKFSPDINFFFRITLHFFNELKENFETCLEGREGNKEFTREICPAFHNQT